MILRKPHDVIRTRTRNTQRISESRMETVAYFKLHLNLKHSNGLSIKCVFYSFLT